MPYDEFLHRYKMLSGHTWPHWRGPSVEGVTYLLRELGVSASEYAFGRTKIFIRSNKTVSNMQSNLLTSKGSLLLYVSSVPIVLGAKSQKGLAYFCPGSGGTA